MPYVYEVAFNIQPEQMTELQVGKSLRRTASYLKARLPGRHGFITADAAYSVDNPDITRVVFRSEWSDWEDVEQHRESSLLEDKVIKEFDPIFSTADMTIRTYAKVGSGPLRGY